MHLCAPGQPSLVIPLFDSPSNFFPCHCREKSLRRVVRTIFVSTGDAINQLDKL